jgi:hypothetical protein
MSFSAIFGVPFKWRGVPILLRGSLKERERGPPAYMAGL